VFRPRRDVAVAVAVDRDVHDNVDAPDNATPTTTRTLTWSWALSFTWALWRTSTLS
jgi:hypothetical protein